MEYGKPSNKLFLFYKMNMPVIASATPAYKAIENELNHRVTYNDIDGFQEIIEHYTKDDVKRISYVNDANNLLDKSYPETLITKTWHQAMSH